MTRLTVRKERNDLPALCRPWGEEAVWDVGEDPTDHSAGQAAH